MSDWRARVESWLNIDTSEEVLVIDITSSTSSSSESLPSLEVLFRRARDIAENSLPNDDFQQQQPMDEGVANSDTSSTSSSESLPTLEVLLRRARDIAENSLPNDDFQQQPMDRGVVDSLISTENMGTVPPNPELIPREDLVNGPSPPIPAPDYDEITSIKSSRDGMDDCCCICFGHFNEKTVTKCGHSFHTSCLQRWRRQHNTCPYCRADFKQLEERE